MSVQPDLLPCPFCGGPASHTGAAIRCNSFACNASMSPRWTKAIVGSAKGNPDVQFALAKADCAKRWNGRAALDAGQLCNSTVEMADDDVSIRCNKCGWHGNEEDLAATIDAIDKEPSRACPTCKTDNYLMDIDLDAGLIGTISTPRHRAVRYQIGNEAGDVFGRDSGYDGPTLTVEIADMNDGLAMLRALAKGGA